MFLVIYILTLFGHWHQCHNFTLACWSLYAFYPIMFDIFIIHCSHALLFNISWLWSVHTIPLVSIITNEPHSIFSPFSGHIDVILADSYINLDDWAVAIWLNAALGSTSHNWSDHVFAIRPFTMLVMRSFCVSSTSLSWHPELILLPSNVAVSLFIMRPVSCSVLSMFPYFLHPTHKSYACAMLLQKSLREVQSQQYKGWRSSHSADYTSSVRISHFSSIQAYSTHSTQYLLPQTTALLHCFSEIISLFSVRD